jgi:hypothetical protein
MKRLPTTLAILLLPHLGTNAAPAAESVAIETPMPPPGWALLERELLRANARACQEFYNRYFDDRGFLECVERWGGDDGPDDAIENLADWPILHALGASDVVLQLTKKAWEGHLRQYTAAKTTQVEFARDGMYYKEFPVKFDWLHNGEGLTVFNLMGLSDPDDPALQRRAVRFAGFYINEDPGAPNYDPAHHIIRSMFNGSRGPLLRKATAVDWAGDPVEVENRFRPGHGERTYSEMLEHFKDYNDVVGDHPQNLLATTLALNAYMLTGEAKYKTWLLEYVEAWRQRTIDNNGIIPTNIGLDGTIGSAAGGKWYGGVYGWGFTVIDPVTKRPVHRNQHALGIVGFGNAFMLTGDDRYLDVWRRQIERINAQAKTIDGQVQYPRMFGDQGWYAYVPSRYDAGASELAYWSMRQDDRERAPADEWFRYLDGRDPGYPERALRSDIALVRGKVQGMRRDPTTPDTRLADDPMSLNPATVGTLIHLMLGGIHPGHRGSVLHCRIRYFDPVARRAGLPADVAALVDALTAETVAVTLVNLNQFEDRALLVQAGGYGEHEFTSVESGGRAQELKGRVQQVELGPGAGGRLVFRMKRYTHQPTLGFPWNRNEP